MLMLCVDSSSQAATAALMCDGELLSEYTQNQKKTHSVKMLPMIEKMIEDVGMELSDVDYFACGIGPGSFTGLRIGVATMRGFAKTLDKKCVAVNSLEALANNVSGYRGKVFSLLSARENECYCAVYENGEEVMPPCVLTLEEIVKNAEGTNCVLVGDGALINRDYFENALPEACFTSERNNMISAQSMAEIALKKIEKNEICDTEGLIPLYLRKSQAEREYDEKMKREGIE